MAANTHIEKRKWKPGGNRSYEQAEGKRKRGQDRLPKLVDRTGAVEKEAESS